MSLLLNASARVVQAAIIIPIDDNANKIQSKMKLKDERINLTNEALLGVKLIKLYGWEEPFQKRISGFITLPVFSFAF